MWNLTVSCKILNRHGFVGAEIGIIVNLSELHIVYISQVHIVLESLQTCVQSQGIFVVM